MFIAAKMIAIYPKRLEVLKMLSEDPDKAAIMAPTIITAVSYTHLTLPTKRIV